MYNLLYVQNTFLFICVCCMFSILFLFVLLNDVFLYFLLRKCVLAPYFVVFLLKNGGFSRVCTVFWLNLCVL